MCKFVCRWKRVVLFYFQHIKKMWIYLQIGVAVLVVLSTTSFCYSIWIVLLLLKLPLKKVVQQLQYFVLAVWWCFYKMTYQQSQVTAETRTLRCRWYEIWTSVIKAFGWAKRSEVRTVCDLQALQMDIINFRLWKQLRHTWDLMHTDLDNMLSEVIGMQTVAESEVG